MYNNKCNQKYIVTHIDLGGKFQTKYDCACLSLRFLQHRYPITKAHFRLACTPTTSLASLSLRFPNQVRLCNPNRARGEAALSNWPAPIKPKDEVCLQTPNWEGQFQSQITHLAATLFGCLVLHASNQCLREGPVKDRKY